MKKLTLTTFFFAIFMLTAFNTQNGSVALVVSEAVAGDHHDSGSSSGSGSDEDSKSKSKSDDDDQSKSKSDEDDSDGTYSELSDDEDSEHGDSTSGGSKVSVCHDGSTLSVGASSESAHLTHGDTAGACVVASSSCDCPPGITECTCADGKKGKPSDLGATAAGGSGLSFKPSRSRSF